MKDCIFGPFCRLNPRRNLMSEFLLRDISFVFFHYFLLQVLDYDLLPKMICQNCATKLDEIDNFRQFCLEAEKMLQDFRTTLNNTVEDGEAKVNSISYSMRNFIKLWQPWVYSLVAGIC